jgi:hypothetical protein
MNYDLQVLLDKLEDFYENLQNKKELVEYLKGFTKELEKEEF